MSNKTEVINAALVKIGANTVASPEEGSEQARKALAVFERLARGELRRQVWSFAKKRADLPPLAATPSGDDFTTGYNLPADCLRLVSLGGNWVFSSIRDGGFGGGDPTFGIEGQTLYTRDRGSQAITYIADLAGQVAKWDATFVEAFSCRLAVELVQSITKNMTLKQSLKQDYAEALKEAKRVNAIELPPQALADDSWVLARLW